MIRLNSFWPGLEVVSMVGLPRQIVQHAEALLSVARQADELFYCRYSSVNPSTLIFLRGRRSKVFVRLRYKRVLVQRRRFSTSEIEEMVTPKPIEVIWAFLMLSARRFLDISGTCCRYLFKRVLREKLTLRSDVRSIMAYFVELWINRQRR